MKLALDQLAEFAFAQKFEVAADTRQRRAQLVRDVRDEVVLRLIESKHLGDVVEGQDHSRDGRIRGQVADGHVVRRRKVTGRSQTHHDLVGGSRAQGRAQCRDVLGVDEVVESVPELRGGSILTERRQHPLRGRAEVDEPTVPVADHDQIRRLFDQNPVTYVAGHLRLEA